MQQIILYGSVARKEEAEKQLENAIYFVCEVEKYILGSENHEEL